MSPETVPTDEDLLKVALQAYGLGADSDLPDEVRFQRGVVRCITRRLEHLGSDRPSSPFVFFLLPGGPSDQESRLTTIPMVDNGLSQLSERFLFVGPAVARAEALDLGGWDDDATVFDYAVKDLGLAGTPAILFDPRLPSMEARYYPDGLDDPDETVRQIQVTRVDVSLDDVFEVIDRVHHDNLVVPGVQGVNRLWKNSAKGHVVEDAERRIQYSLKVGLSAVLATCVVREEQHSVPGRLDLEIEARVPGEANAIVRFAILELKVLRGFNSSGTSVSQNQIDTIVADGVVQADAYRSERESRDAALCCFDMRTSPGQQDCFAHVKDDASVRGVTLRVWPIYMSAGHYRKSVYSAES